eukprot:464841_1
MHFTLNIPLLCHQSYLIILIKPCIYVTCAWFCIRKHFLTQSIDPIHFDHKLFISTAGLWRTRYYTSHCVSNLLRILLIMKYFPQHLSSPNAPKLCTFSMVKYPSICTLHTLSIRIPHIPLVIT